MSKMSEIAGVLKKEFRERRLHAGERAASVHGIAKRFRVAPVTADRVLKLLEKENEIYRIKAKGSFLCKDAPVPKRIIYFSESKYQSRSGEYFIERARFEKIREVFSGSANDIDLVPNPVRFETGELARLLENYDGMLISASHLLYSGKFKAFDSFRGKTVLFGLERALPGLRFSQVVPDFSTAFDRIPEKYTLSGYDRCLVLYSGCHNYCARYRAKSVRDFFRKHGILSGKTEFVPLNTSSYTASYVAYRHLMANPERNTKKEKLLIISLSDYLTDGIGKALSESGMRADVLSFDNLDGYGWRHDSAPWVSAIDCEMVRIGETAAKLLLRIVDDDDDCKYIVSVPTTFADRGSIRPQCTRRKSANTAENIEMPAVFY